MDIQEKAIKTEVHRREASFFDEKAEKVLALPQADQESLLFIDQNIVFENYPDYYQYAYNILGDINGKILLDMGCGSGKSSVLLAKKGAVVAAFDISPKFVEIARLRARINEVQDQVRVEQMVAEDMAYDTESFDCVFGVGVLHHINIERAASEIFRVLKNNGQAVFIEPIVFSPLLRKLRNLSLVRKIVPNKGNNLLITEDERQLVEEDLKSFKNLFKFVDYKSFQLFSRLDRIIGGYPATRNKKLIALINRLDRILLDNFYFLAKYGRWAVIRLAK